MAAISLNDSEVTCTVEFSGGAVPYTHPTMAKWDTLFRAWFCANNIASFLFQESATPGFWRYEFAHTDGRKWKQKIDFTAPPFDSPLMDFGGDFWRVSEFEPHRQIRDQVVLMHNQFGVSKITVARP